MKKVAVKTAKAPQAIGPYSQGIKLGNLLFISGQIPADPETGGLVIGDIRNATIRVMENLKAIIEEAGADMSDVLKTTVFLSNMENFAVVNEVYGNYFNIPYPARACIEVSRLPKDVNIEIEAVVLCPCKND